MKIIDKLIEMYLYFYKFIETKKKYFKVFQIESFKND